MSIRKSIAAAVIGGSILASSVALAAPANAVKVTGCGDRARAVLVSHPVSLTHNGQTLGQLYLGYYSDCVGVYSEIHWNYGTNNGVDTTKWKVGGVVYLRDENGTLMGFTRFNHGLDGSTNNSA